MILIAILCAAAGFAVWHFAKPASAVATVIVTDGETMQVDLSKEQTIRIDAKLPVTLEVRGGAIRFINSQCPDHICEGFGFISRQGEYAICMPAGVSVYIY